MTTNREKNTHTHNILNDFRTEIVKEKKREARTKHQRIITVLDEYVFMISKSFLGALFLLYIYSYIYIT